MNHEKKIVTMQLVARLLLLELQKKTTIKNNYLNEDY